MENEFSCSLSGLSMSPLNYGLYECKTTLTGLDIDENKFYFRCKDKSGNVNEESYEFGLTGTEPLKLVSIEPEGTLFYKNITLKAVTSEGAENGKAICAFSNQDEQFANMIEFANTETNIHTQSLELPLSRYIYYVKCRDIAGNEVSTSTQFEVAVDTIPPKLLHLYTDASVLHIELDEDSICEYNLVERFRFGDGTLMTGEGNIHEASLMEGAKRYYIICQDKFENEMSIIVYP
jgi:hypothetical protein